MRRRDREVTRTEDILAILDRCQVAHLGLCGDNTPYVVPLNFGYAWGEDGLRLYFHCAGKGRKLDMIARNSNACFVADCGHSLIAGDEACEYSYAFESVMGEGTIAPLSNPEDKLRGFICIMRHYGADNPVFSPEAVARTTVLELRVTSFTGKRKALPA